MELRFPFKNIAVHTLLDFLARDKYDDFVLTKKGQYPYPQNYFERDVEHLQGIIDNYEAEIKQQLETTGQSTIDAYFHELSGNITLIMERSKPEVFSTELRAWNQQALENYRLAILKSEQKYHESDGRQRKHLEEFEAFDYLSLLTGSMNPPKRKLVNYNFYCVEERLLLSDETYLDQYLDFFEGLFSKFFDVAAKYGRMWSAGELKSKLQEVQQYRPVVFFEGDLDVDYVRKAAELLGHEDIFGLAEIKSGNGAPNMDNIWRLHTVSGWQDTPRKIVLFYDCDTNKLNEHQGDLHKVAIPKISDNPISKGIENLFPQTTVERIIRDNHSLIDTTEVKSMKRGAQQIRFSYEVDKMEKRNLCNWLLRNGTKEDFANFSVVFSILRDILNPPATPAGE